MEKISPEIMSVLIAYPTEIDNIAYRFAEKLSEIHIKNIILRNPQKFLTMFASHLTQYNPTINPDSISITIPLTANIENENFAEKFIQLFIRNTNFIDFTVNLENKRITFNFSVDYLFRYVSIDTEKAKTIIKKNIIKNIKTNYNFGILLACLLPSTTESLIIEQIKNLYPDFYMNSEDVVDVINFDITAFINEVEKIINESTYAICCASSCSTYTTETPDEIAQQFIRMLIKLDKEYTDLTSQVVLKKFPEIYAYLKSKYKTTFKKEYITVKIKIPHNISRSLHDELYQKIYNIDAIRMYRYKIRINRKFVRITITFTPYHFPYIEYNRKLPVERMIYLLSKYTPLTINEIAECFQVEYSYLDPIDEIIETAKQIVKDLSLKS